MKTCKSSQMQVTLRLRVHQNYAPTPRTSQGLEERPDWLREQLQLHPLGFRDITERIRPPTEQQKQQRGASAAFSFSIHNEEMLFFVIQHSIAGMFYSEVRVGGLFNLKGKQALLIMKLQCNQRKSLEHFTRKCLRHINSKTKTKKSAFSLQSQCLQTLLLNHSGSS